MEFAKTLTTISERHLLRMQLSEEVLRVVQDTRRISSPGARARALRLVRQELRGLDLGLLRERLEDLSHPNSRRASTPADDWRKRLLDGGFRGRIQRRGGLVEDDHSRPPQQQARDGQPLPLPAG